MTGSDGAPLASPEGLDMLDGVWTLTTPDTPIPFSPSLEDAYLPGRERIAGFVLGQLEAVA